MAAPRIVGVEPVDLPGGAYRANMDDGSSMMIHGPSGEALARRYASTGENAMGPNALAANDAQPEDREANDAADAIRKGVIYSNPVTALPALAYAGAKKAYNAITGPDEAPKAAPKERMGTTTVEPPQAQPEQAPTQQASMQQGAPQQTQQAAPAQSQAGPLNYTMKGIDPATGKEVQGAAVRASDGSVGIMLPGSKGSPGGMTALGKEAVAHTAEAEKEHARQGALEEIAHQRGVDAAIDEGAARQGFLIEQQKQLINQAAQQQDEVDKQQAAVDKLHAGYQAARDDFMSSKVDPDQYMKADKGRAIFSMIGVMLNQFGSAFTRQPNIAADFVNSQIDRNIRAQEAQINVKGKAADNMLSDLTRETGDLKLAKIAMKQMLTERAAMQAEQVALSSKNDQIKANAQAVSAKLAGDAALQDNGRKQAFVEHVMTNPLYYRKGVAGTAPRVALPTQQAIGEAAHLGIDTEKLAVEKAKAEADAAKIKAGGNVPDTVKKSLSELDAAIAGLDKMKNDDPGGYIVRTGGGYGASDKAKQLSANAAAIGPGVARATEGDAATKDSMDRAIEGLAAHSADQRAAAREAYRQQLLEKRAAILGQQTP